MKIGILVTILVIAMQGQADMAIDFLQKGGDPASTRVEIKGAGVPVTDLSGELTATASGAANPGVDPLNNSFTSGNSSGRIYIDFQAAATFSADASSWNVDTTDALISTKASGWGLYTNGAAAVDGVRNPQALIFTVDLSDFTLGQGDTLVLKSVSSSNATQTRWWQKTEAGGVEASSDGTWAMNITLDPLDPAGTYTFAMASNTSSQQNYLTGLTIDVIPEPATLGLVGAFGGLIIMVRRRLML